MLEVGATPGCKGCDNDTSALNVLSVRLVKPMNLVTLSNQHLTRTSCNKSPCQQSIMLWLQMNLMYPLRHLSERKHPMKSFLNARLAVLKSLMNILTVRQLLVCWLLPKFLMMRVHFCREYVQDILNESLNQGGVTGSLGASAHPQNDTTKGARQLKSRHSLKGSDIPFEFACDKDSNLGKLHSNTVDGCTVGVTAKDMPARRPWGFVSSSARLADRLSKLKCNHSKHEHLQGKWTRLSAFHPRPLCVLMLEPLFPHVVNQHAWSSPCGARSRQPHRQKLVAGYPSVPLDIAILSLLLMFIDFWIEVNGKIDQRFWMPSTRRSKGFLPMGHGMSQKSASKQRSWLKHERKVRRFMWVPWGPWPASKGMRTLLQNESSQPALSSGLMLCVTKPIKPLSLTVDSTWSLRWTCWGKRMFYLRLR